MVRVGGGWVDLSEYFKEYVSYYKRCFVVVDGFKVEVWDVFCVVSGCVIVIGFSFFSCFGLVFDLFLIFFNVCKFCCSSGVFGNEVFCLFFCMLVVVGVDDSFGVIL